MKNIFISLVIVILSQTTQAQYIINQNVGPYFIQSNSGEWVRFTIDGTNVPAGTDHVKFGITDLAQTTVYDTSLASYGVNYDGTNFYWDKDMGSLPSAPTNFIAWAAYKDINNTTVGYTDNNANINLTPVPSWILNYGGTITGVTENTGNNLLQMHGSLPLTNLPLYKNVSGIIGLTDKAFNLTNQQLDFDITYQMADGSATAAQTTVSANMQPLDNAGSVLSSTNFTGALTFDNSFNITMNGTAIWSPNPITKAFSFEGVPLAGGNVGIGSVGLFCVNSSLEFNLAPKIKAQIYAQYDQAAGRWGFIQNGNDVTQFLGKVTASATAQGELKAVCGSLFGYNVGIGTIARGQITANLTLGGGVQYYDVPAATPTKLWYGEFSIYAEGEVLGSGTKSGTYSPNPWGDSSSFGFRPQVANEFFTGNTYSARSASHTPQAWPMGKISTRDSVLASAWIDDLNFGSNNALLVSYFSPLTNTFSSPITVAQNDSGIANHSIALLPNKNIIVTWSQLKERQSQIASMAIDDVTKSQDIYIAVIDISSNSVVYKGLLADANLASGNGEPRIHWGNGQQGMITWQSGNPGTGSDIYAAQIQESGSNYSVYLPVKLNNSPGFNYNVTISYTNGDSAMATWFNDPDMNQLTHNEEVYYSLWNGSAWWVTPLSRFNAVSQGAIITGYSVNTMNKYGVEALTYYKYQPDSTIVNKILIGEWKDGNPDSPLYGWSTDSETVWAFHLPQVAVSESGVANLILQEQDLTIPNDVGKLNLYVRDLNSSVLWTNVINNNPQYTRFLCDTNQFIWDMSAKFGYLTSTNSTDIMYVFTQEMDTVGNTHPTHGDIFGNPNLNLVLRAFQVNSNGGTITLTDVPEPPTGNVSGFYQELKPFNYSFELKPNFPNPFNDLTNIPFHVYGGSNVKIELFNLNGQSFGDIFNAELAPGDYVTTFQRRNLASGLYFYRISMGSDSQTGKLVITD